MKQTFFFLIVFLLFVQDITAQLLLENKTGDVQFVPLISITETQTQKSSGIIKLNTGDQSIGIDYFNAPNAIGSPKYKFWSFGAKAKPTEGYASVLKNGQFSPGITLSGAITQVKLFDREATKPENNFFDWGALYFNYAINKYQLYKSDTLFKNQVYSTNFNGLGLGINYNILLKSSLLISVKFGYARKNNYNDLNGIEVRDTKIYFDTASNTRRDIITTKTAKQGTFKEFDSYPFSLALTKLTSDDPSNKGLSFGYSIYLNVSPTNTDKPNTTTGCILYLAKMKEGISTPTLGLNFQFSDFFDVNGINNGLLKRLSVGLTTNFSIF